MDENWRGEDEKRFKCKYKMKCKNCNKKFTCGSQAFAYCCAKCKLDYEREVQRQNQQKKKLPLKDKSCCHCQISFKTNNSTQLYCSLSCRQKKQNEDYLKKWQSSEAVDEKKRSKVSRLNQEKIKWSATEEKDNVNKKLKVMRG